MYRSVKVNKRKKVKTEILKMLSNQKEKVKMLQSNTANRYKI